MCIKAWLSITNFSFQGSDRYIVSSDTRAQLRFLEKLDHLEKQRKAEEEREMLLRAAKVRSLLLAFQGNSGVLQTGEHIQVSPICALNVVTINPVTRNS